jgi:hypothetical protein
MTIFHVIKYPISNPPTESELNKLPIEIYGEWLQTIGFNMGDVEPSFLMHMAGAVDNIAMITQTSSSPDIFLNAEKVDLLRKLIAEYQG